MKTKYLVIAALVLGVGFMGLVVTGVSVWWIMSQRESRLISQKMALEQMAHAAARPAPPAAAPSVPGPAASGLLGHAPRPVVDDVDGDQRAADVASPVPAWRGRSQTAPNTYLRNPYQSWIDSAAAMDRDEDTTVVDDGSFGFAGRDLPMDDAVEFQSSGQRQAGRLSMYDEAGYGELDQTSTLALLGFAAAAMQAYGNGGYSGGEEAESSGGNNGGSFSSRIGSLIGGGTVLSDDSGFIGFTDSEGRSASSYR